MGSEMCIRDSSSHYLLARKAMECRDLDLDDPVFVAFLDDYENASLAWPTDWREAAAGFISRYRNFGCKILSNLTAYAETSSVFQPYVEQTNPCAEGGSFFPVKPMSYFCPVSCGCRSGDAHCPDACPARVDFSRTECPAWQSQFISALHPELPNGTLFCPQPLVRAADA